MDLFSRKSSVFVLLWSFSLVKHLKLLVSCNCCKCNIEKLEKKKEMEKKCKLSGEV